jgi:hypothetical protein
LSVTATFSPGVAEPQTGTSVPLCKTMWSLKSAEGLTAVPAAAVKHNVAERDAMSDSLLINFMNFRLAPANSIWFMSADLQFKRFLARLLAGHRHRQSLRTLGQFQLADL